MKATLAAMHSLKVAALHGQCPRSEDLELAVMFLRDGDLRVSLEAAQVLMITGKFELLPVIVELVGVQIHNCRRQVLRNMRPLSELVLYVPRSNSSNQFFCRIAIDLMKHESECQSSAMARANFLAYLLRVESRFLVPHKFELSHMAKTCTEGETAIFGELLAGTETAGPRGDS